MPDWGEGLMKLPWGSYDRVQAPPGGFSAGALLGFSKHSV